MAIQKVSVLLRLLIVKVTARVLQFRTFSQGKLRGLMEAYGYEDNGGSKGIYIEMLNDLDKMATAFANAFNAQHREGHILDKNNSPSAKGSDFLRLILESVLLKGLSLLLKTRMKLLHQQMVRAVTGKMPLS